MAELCIELFHGRNDIDERLDDWGFDGPIIGPVKFVHCVYQSETSIGLIDTEGKVAHLLLKFVDNCVLFDSK